MNKLKKQLLLISLLLLSGLSCLQAQDSSGRQLKLTDMYIHNGFAVAPGAHVNIHDFRSLAPGSDILKGDYSGFHPYRSYSNSSNNTIYIQLGFQTRNKRTKHFNPNRQFRLGFSYWSDIGFSASMSHQVAKQFDTISTPQGNLYYDSVHTRGLSMEYNSNQLRLDASYIFKTDAAARWSLYSGVGISAGMSLNNFLTIQSTNAYSIQPESYGGGRSHTYASDSKTESFRMKSNYGASVYIPLGLDFRIGKKRPFWKRLHLFLEGRPGINFLVVPDLTTFASGYINNSFGLRVGLD